jgi:hypothetical protein
VRPGWVVVRVGDQVGECEARPEDDSLAAVVDAKRSGQVSNCSIWQCSSK